MAAEVKKEEKTELNGKKGFWQIAEVRMLCYVIPVAAVLLVLALLLGK